MADAKLDYILENLEKETMAELQKTYKDILMREAVRNAVGRFAPEQRIKDEIIYLERTLKSFAKMSKEEIKFLRKRLEKGKIQTRILWITLAISKIRLNLKSILGDSEAIKKDSAYLEQIVVRLQQLSNLA